MSEGFSQSTGFLHVVIFLNTSDGNRYPSFKFCFVSALCTQTMKNTVVILYVFVLHMYFDTPTIIMGVARN